MTFSCIIARISYDTNYDILLLACYEFTNDILVLFLFNLMEMASVSVMITNETNYNISLLVMFIIN